MGEQDRRRIVLDLAQRAMQIVGAVGVMPAEAMGELIAKADQPERPPLLAERDDIVFEQRNARHPPKFADAAAIVGRIGRQRRRPPIVIAENGVGSKRRFQPGELLGPGAGRDVARHEMLAAGEIAQQHRQVGLLRIGEIDDLGDPLGRHPGLAGVDVGDDGDFQRARRLGQTGDETS